MEEKLIKLVKVLETRQLANIFKSYMEEKDINKFDGRKKDNRNTYFIYGKDEYWDRVFCIYYKDKEQSDIEIILRKRSGLYLIIKHGARIVFESNFNGSRINTYFDKLLFNKIYTDHMELFEELFKVV